MSQQTINKIIFTVALVGVVLALIALGMIQEILSSFGV